MTPLSMVSHVRLEWDVAAWNSNCSIISFVFERLAVGWGFWPGEVVDVSKVAE